MLQDCLNRTEAHLWAVLTNGRRVRLLRDSSSFATAAYVEFDLEAIFDGELFSEFVLLYCVLHASRFAVAEGAAASGCWLEKWRAEAVSSGARALDQLRLGVQNALTALGTGFLRHPDNTRLREDTDPKALRDALLRLVYRLLFVFVAEDRGPCSTRRPTSGSRRRTTATSPPPGCASAPAGARAPPMVTSTRRCVSSSTPSARRAAAPSWACPASVACSPPRRPMPRWTA